MEPLILIAALAAVLVAGALGALLGVRIGAARASAQQATAAGELQAARSRLEVVEAERARERDVAERRHAAELEHVRAEAEQRVADERQRGREALAELQLDAQRRADEFAKLSSAALERNSALFLEQAEERLRRSQTEGAAELAKRERAVQQLVEPLSKSLDSVRSEVTAAEKARAEANAALAEQLHAMRSSSEQLTAETRQLVTALRAPQVRGRWGELQLRRVVEAAGMLQHVDFTEQAHHATDEGALRPDMLVHLPGDKQVIVDSKVAFAGYLEAMEATDDATRDKRLDAHARHLRDHIDQLGSKAYWEAVPGSPEFVVLFVPAEPFLNAALERDPTLFERAFERNVVLATPATLVALLRTVGYTWRQEQLAGEAMAVLEVGRELHKRLGTMGSHLTKLGNSLNRTVEAYNAFNASLDRNVVTQARRFSSLQGLEPSLERTPPLEVLAVPAQKPDVHRGDELEAAGPEAGGGAGTSADDAIADMAREASEEAGSSAVA
ncbi:DNA recombination protein RmuC [Agrococcus sp. HG114]|uniref:DNA recombination protein RmuC n=1 Tax=Agrococcus sp. HG114 TaxID=2969757 RepID=UPI00215AF7D4|nr:DNA recombination protein RmuC [Agrococcus sp. HG114]MCR8670834.1 DNA recombination protein RmuC [Agrococcus sp. HG114]